ncbi:MAG: DUF2283 domain-containing protein [Bacteriovoracales bacterium]|nr:DUF2283 domain-containing protein [Bacteriovoracales bacterium]
MKIHFDEKSDAIYIRLDKNKEVAESQEIKDGIVFDFDEGGEVVGIEILKVKKRIPIEELKELTLQVV